ncbi:unnamed protein product [Musa textilis]
MARKRENEGKKKTSVMAWKRGAWSAEEDRKLAEYVTAHGDKRWTTVAAKAGLDRCGKSCRLRWLNYLRPGIKRGNISEEEEDLIIRLHNLLGNRWALIAGRLPGRTDNEIKNHWNTHLSKRSLTIQDLNVKMNQKLESSSGVASPSPALASDALPVLHSTADGSELNVGQPFDFTLNWNATANEFEAEGYGYGFADHEELFRGGSLVDAHRHHLPVELNELSGFIDCEEWYFVS